VRTEIDTVEFVSWFYGYALQSPRGYEATLTLFVELGVDFTTQSAHALTACMYILRYIS
jgi:hypothetical protein